MKGMNFLFFMKRAWLCVITVCVLTMGLGGCARKNTTYANDLSSRRVMNSVCDAISSDEGYMAMDNGYFTVSTWGEDYPVLLENAIDYEVVISQNFEKNIDEIGIFHIADDVNIGKLTALVESYVQSQTARMESLLQAYNPREIPKLKEAKVVVCGRYIMYTILSGDNTAKAKKAFVRAIGE